MCSLSLCVSMSVCLWTNQFGFNRGVCMIIRGRIHELDPLSTSVTTNLHSFPKQRKAQLLIVRLIGPVNVCQTKKRAPQKGVFRVDVQNALVYTFNPFTQSSRQSIGFILCFNEFTFILKFYALF